ncbi:MAG: xanthine dehydrogenase family protein subunit M [Holophagaceae bacterium]
MKGDAPACAVHTPASLDEALAFLAGHPDWRPLAGGTDLMVPFAAGRLPDVNFLNLDPLDALRGIEMTDSHLTLGALTTYSEIRWHEGIRAAFPNLVQSAWVTGARAIQNRGTIGGNLVNASPAADTPPSLLAYGAEVELRSASGARWVDYDAFHQGYKRTALRPGELLTRVRVARPAPGAFHFYRKVGTRQAQAIAKVCLAAHGRLEGGRVAEFRAAFGAVAPVPKRAHEAESQVQGRAPGDVDLEAARAALARDIAPIDDLRSSARYRRFVSERLFLAMLKDFLAHVG